MLNTVTNKRIFIEKSAVIYPINFLYNVELHKHTNKAAIEVATFSFFISKMDH